MGDIIKLGANLIGGAKKKKAIKKAVAAQVAAGAEASGTINGMLNQTAGQFAPFIAAGAQGMPLYTSAVTGQGYNGFTQSPGYQFRLSEGLKGVEGSAAARGVLQSGGTLKGVNNYAQNTASNEFQNYVGNLRDLTNLGFTATNNLGGLRANAGNSLADIATGIGNARASGYLQRGDITANQWQSGGNALANIFDNIATGGASGAAKSVSNSVKSGTWG